jgi:multidrug efflux system membrane fusion protein
MREATLSVTAILSGEENKPRGILTFVNNAVDMNTGTILLKATFTNDDNALWPGQFVQTSLTLNTIKQAMVVPSQAVQIGQNGEYIFVVRSDSTAEVRTNLATGATYDGQTVITRGVKPGEIIVIDGQLKLTPGAKLSVKASDAEGSSTNTAVATP